MMRYFKLPLIVTGVTFVVALLITIGAVIWIQKDSRSQSEAAERAKTLGMVVGIGGSLIPAPFWIFAAGRYGKDRRAELEDQADGVDDGDAGTA